MKNTHEKTAVDWLEELEPGTWIAYENGYTGQTEESRFVGCGAYPYDCQEKDDYPNQKIFNGVGGWFTEREVRSQRFIKNPRIVNRDR